MALQIISDEAKEQLRQLLAARDKVEELEAELKTAKEDLEEVELDVYEMFEAPDDEGQPAIRGTITVNLGEPYGVVKFRTRKTHYADVADDDKLREYYEERGELDNVMTEPKWVKKELNSDVREILDKPDGRIPPGMTYHTKRGMTITRQKG
jgi:hypothetical protein